MGKPSTIDAFFKRKNIETVDSNTNTSTPITDTSLNHKDRPTKSPRIVENENFDINMLERDPGLHQQIWEYPIRQFDEVRRAYLAFGPYRCELPKYPKSGSEKHLRSFQASWFDLFPSWLEYSPTKDAVFCLPCYLFNKQSALPGQNAFTVDGFRNWKKVRNGKNCAFLLHVGKDPNSPHKNAEQACRDLLNQPQHIERRFENFSSQQIRDNRLRVKTSIDVIRWLTFQGCALRGHDETKGSRNRGNFLELLSLLASYNDKVGDVVLEKAPQNASYTSPKIQKKILHILATKVKTVIREEIGEAKFCLIVDESRDESKKEQMSIVVRFVDKNGFVQERFFGLVHVPNTAALTLKDGIFSILSQYNLNIQDIRGQGYDGASNMRGEWNGLQALIIKECPYAYYVHCFAHRLQLTLVASAKEVILIHQFFTKLNSIVNIVGASCKRNDELQVAQAANIAHLISIDELESGKGLNQIGTLQRPGDTRWSSHLRSVSSIIKMYSATCEVLLNIIEDGTTSSQRGDVDAAYETMTSFEFVFILHLMEKILEVSNLLCQALQYQSQDILNAMHLVSSTKALMQKLRDDGWDELLNKVKSFCEARSIDIPNLSARYVARRGRARHQQDEITLEHHYRIDIFHAVIDVQLQELNNKFNENTIELLILSSALDPRDGFTLSKIDDICKLANKFYPQDFTDYEKLQLRMQLEHFEHLRQLPDFHELSTISDLCSWLVKTRKSMIYPLVYRLVTLVLTLSVSTATTERSFSAMNIVKSRLRNKMEDDFLSDSLIVYIEREITEKFGIDSILNDFRDLKERRALF